MFKIGTKSYLKNLPHFFTILGVITFFLIISLCIAIPMMVNTATTFGNSIKDSLTSLQGKLNPKQVLDSFIVEVGNLNWGSPIDALTQMCNLNWVITTLQKCSGLTEEIKNLQPQLTAAVNTFANGITVEVFIIIGFFLVGVAASVIITKIAIDIHIRSNNIFRYVISFILDTLIFVGIVYLFLYCLAYTTIAKYILLAGVFLLMLILYPIQNTLVYGRGKVKLKEVMSPKNFFGLALSTLIGYALSFLIFFLSYKYFNQIFAFIISVPLFILTFLICENTSKNYVCERYFVITTGEKAIKQHIAETNNDQKNDVIDDSNKKKKRRR